MGDDIFVAVCPGSVLPKCQAFNPISDQGFQINFFFCLQLNRGFREGQFFDCVLISGCPATKRECALIEICPHTVKFNRLVDGFCRYR